MYTIFIILLIASPFLWLATLLILTEAKTFWKVFLIHTSVFIIYMTFVLNYSTLLTGHDEYGLGQIGLTIFFIITHIIVGFIHGLYRTFKKRYIR